MTDAAEHLQAFLDALGFHGDPEMAQTAERVTRMLQDWVPEDQPPELSACTVGVSGPVKVANIPFYSLCAHHLLPFWGTADVVYQPRGAVLGLGAIPRLVQHYSRSPQLQERLTDAIADTLMGAVEAEGVLVRTRARHMCVEMRGPSVAVDVEVSAARGATDVLRSLM